MGRYLKPRCPWYVILFFYVIGKYVLSKRRQGAIAPHPSATLQPPLPTIETAVITCIGTSTRLGAKRLKAMSMVETWTWMLSSFILCLVNMLLVKVSYVYYSSESIIPFNFNRIRHSSKSIFVFWQVKAVKVVNGSYYVWSYIFGVLMSISGLD